MAGATGKYLDFALKILHEQFPAVFGSPCRYDYRITNAFSQPLWFGKDGRTEAAASEVLLDEEVARVVRQLEGCDSVILCGKRAGLLMSLLAQSGRTIVSMPHTGVRSLVTSYPFPRGTGCQRRAEAWAEDLLQKWVKQ